MMLIHNESIMKNLLKSLPFVFIVLSCTNKVTPNTQQENFSNLEKDTINAQFKQSEKDTLSRNDYYAILEEQGLVRIKSLSPTIKVDLKYATNDNFTKKVLYDDLREAYLHPIAAQKLSTAQELLKEQDSTLSLLVYDAVRPLSIQKEMFEVVRNTPFQAYVANPSRTGLHNYGIAVDLTICDSDGMPLDMGTPFDYFGKAAGINKEDELKAQGILTEQQIKNRKLLRSIMTKAGFLTIRGEWWHFNALSLAEAKSKTKLIE